MADQPDFNRAAADEEIAQWRGFVDYSTRLLNNLQQQSHVARDLQRLRGAVEAYIQELEQAKEHLPE